MSGLTSKHDTRSEPVSGLTQAAGSASAEHHRFAKVAKSIRLTLLLRHLHEIRWHKSPKNVGLKTALDAEEMGLVESRGELRSRTYRLSAAGCQFVALLPRNLERHDPPEAIPSPGAVLAATACATRRAGGPGSPPMGIVMVPPACLQNGTLARLPGLTLLPTMMKP
jgi:hypothetical protein